MQLVDQVLSRPRSPLGTGCPQKFGKLLFVQPHQTRHGYFRRRGWSRRSRRRPRHPHGLARRRPRDGLGRNGRLGRYGRCSLGRRRVQPGGKLGCVRPRLAGRQHQTPKEHRAYANSTPVTFIGHAARRHVPHQRRSYCTAKITIRRHPASSRLDCDIWRFNDTLHRTQKFLQTMLIKCGPVRRGSSRSPIDHGYWRPFSRGWSLLYHRAHLAGGTMPDFSSTSIGILPWNYFQDCA